MWCPCLVVHSSCFEVLHVSLIAMTSHFVVASSDKSSSIESSLVMLRAFLCIRMKLSLSSFGGVGCVVDWLRVVAFLIAIGTSPSIL